MQSETGPGPETPQRLHPLSLVFGLASAARPWIFPALLLLFASRGQSWFLWAFFPAAIGAVVKYLTFRYRLGPEEMVIREGVLTRNERHIPYGRIQNIDLVQNPFHRLARVAVVKLETASGGKPEAVIRVLSLDAVEEMRSRVFAAREPAQAQAEAGTVDEPAAELLRMTNRDVVLFGLISNKGMVVLAAAFGLIWQLDLFDEDWEGWTAQARAMLPESLNRDGIVTGVLLGVGGLIAALLLLRLFSVAWAVFKFHGFNLSRSGDDIRTRYGLLTHYSTTIPRHRIQLLSTRRTLLHRWCGRTTIEVETAGGRSEDDNGAPTSERLRLAPLTPDANVPALVRQVLPEIDMQGVDWQPVSPRARRRRLKRSAIVLALLTVVAAAVLRSWWSLAIFPLLLPLAALGAQLYVKHTAWALTPRAVLYKSGWWTRRLSVVLFDKIQNVALAQSPFDRRHDMASVAVDTAGAATLGHGVDIGYLDRPVAGRITDRLYDEAEHSAFRW